MLKRNLLSGYLSGLLVLGFASLHGQTATDEQEVFDLPEFVVEEDVSGYVAQTAFSATRTRTPIKDIPISYSVLTSDFIKDIGAQNITDALRYASSVQVAPGGGAGAQGVTFKVRGFDSAWMLKDGFVRYQAPNVANTERVEVIKGAAAFLYGRSGPGGAVNYITKRPLYESQTQVYTYAGSDSYLRYGVDVTGPIGETLAFRVILDHYDRDEWWDDGSDRNSMIAIGMNVRPTKNTNWYLGTESNERHFNVRPGLLMTSDLAQNYTGEARKGNAGFQSVIVLENAEAIGLTESQQALGGGALLQSLTQEQRRIVRDNFAVIDRYAPELSPRGRKLNLAGPEPQTEFFDYSIISDFTTTLFDGLSLRNGTIYSYREWTWPWVPNADNNILRTGGAVDPAGPSVELWLGDPNWAGPGLLENKFFSNQLDLAANYRTDAFTLKVLFGGEFQQDTFRNSDQSGRFFADGVDISDMGTYVAYLNDFPDLLMGVDGVPTVLKTNEVRQNIAGYINLQATFFEEKLRLMGGFRRENSKVTERYGAWGTNRPPEITKTSPQIGIMVEILEDVNLFAMQSEDFNPNTFGVTSGGELLMPPDGENREIGVKGELWNGKVTVQGSYFQVEQSGRNVPDPDDPNFRIAGGAFEIEGLELDVMATIAANWQVIANYTYLDSQIAKIPNRDELIGQPLADVPDHSFNIWSRYSFTDGSLAGGYIGFGARYQGDRKAANQYFNTIVNEAYVAFDMLLGYDFTIRDDIDFELTLNIRNLFDEEYVERQHQPSAPREILLGARVTF